MCLTLLLYDTRSYSVKPSWAITKFTLWYGFRLFTCKMQHYDGYCYSYSFLRTFCWPLTRGKEILDDSYSIHIGRSRNSCGKSAFHARITLQHQRNESREFQEKLVVFIQNTDLLHCFHLTFINLRKSSRYLPFHSAHLDYKHAIKRTSKEFIRLIRALCVKN